MIISDEHREQVINGKRIYLRSLVEDDCSVNYVSWLNDCEINQYLETRWNNHTCTDVRRFILEMAESIDSILFGIFLMDDGSHIGNVKVGPINKNHLYGSVSYFIGDKASWGYGYGTEAVKLITKFCFDELNINKCVAGVYSGNYASQKVLEKSGYVQEGCAKEQLRGINGWEDYLIYGIINKGRRQ